MNEPESSKATGSKWVPILIVVGIIAYVTISGTTRSCPTCTIITEKLGIPSLATGEANE